MPDPTRMLMVGICDDHEHVMVPGGMTEADLERAAVTLFAATVEALVEKSGFPADIAREEIGARMLHRAGDLMEQRATP